MLQLQCKSRSSVFTCPALSLCCAVHGGSVRLPTLPEWTTRHGQRGSGQLRCETIPRGITQCNQCYPPFDIISIFVSENKIKETVAGDIYGVDLSRLEWSCSELPHSVPARAAPGQLRAKEGQSAPGGERARLLLGDPLRGAGGENRLRG